MMMVMIMMMMMMMMMMGWCVTPIFFVQPPQIAYVIAWEAVLTTDPFGSATDHQFKHWLNVK